MVTTLDRLRELKAEDDEQAKPFGHYQEEAIVSMALDHPEFFTSVARFMKPSMFRTLEMRFVVAMILNLFEEHEVIPTRGMLRDEAKKIVTEDDNYDTIFDLIDRPSEPRDIPILKKDLLNWAKHKAFGMIYSEEAMDAYHRGDFQHIEELIDSANRIADVGQRGFWFFQNYEMLFDPAAIDHHTTGFPKLNNILNNGGPSTKEVLCWLAATNVGKSMMLCNNAISSLRGDGMDGTPGQNVLLITFELSTTKTALRCLASANNIKMDDIISHQGMVRRQMESMRNTYKTDLYIQDLPPDECSVSHVYAILDNLRNREGWRPTVVILDYMDLMVSRVKEYNRDDYTRQKHVANEIRGLAKNEDVLVFTATQTNRSGAQQDKVPDLTSAAESFGKQFSLDYVVSLSQNANDLNCTPPRISMFVAKNRNGQKHETIECEIEYDKMIVREIF